jgi:lipid-A-disaccharide synthase
MSSSINKEDKKNLRIALVAGEKSGDKLGGDLILSLKKIFPNAKFLGVGGEEMIAAGMESFFDMEKISVMGIIEPLLNIFELLSLRKRLKEFLVEQNPDIFIGIDAPDFNLPISKFLKQRTRTKTVQYVSPSIWAWREGRIKTIEKSVDKVLTLFPFEKEAYKNSTLDVTFVGHPLAHKFSENINKKEIRKRKSINPDAKIVALLPGSRTAEVSRIIKVLLKTASKIKELDESVLFFMPFATIDHQLLVTNKKEYEWIKFSVGDSQEVLSYSDIGIVTSGTATLEAALLQTPMVVVYRTSWLTYNLVKPLLKVSEYALPNLLSGKKVVKELIQDEVTPSNLLEAFIQLDKEDYQNTLKEFRHIHSELKSRGPQTAANCIAEMVKC